MSKAKSSELKGITMLLPFYLNEHFPSLYEDALGFRILWADNREDTEKIVGSSIIDIALEWQHGPEDYPIREILKKYNKKDVPILLCLNWHRQPPPNLENLGYAGYLNVPFRAAGLKQKIYEVLPETTKALLKAECWLE